MDLRAFDIVVELGLALGRLIMDASGFWAANAISRISFTVHSDFPQALLQGLSRTGVICKRKLHSILSRYPGNTHTNAKTERLQRYGVQSRLTRRSRGEGGWPS
jgi:hypothetical protein